MYIPKQTQFLLKNDAGIDFYYLDKVMAVYDMESSVKYGVVEGRSGSGRNLLIKWHHNTGWISPEEIWEPNMLKLYEPRAERTIKKLVLVDDGKQQYYKLQ